MGNEPPAPGKENALKRDEQQILAQATNITRGGFLLIQN